MFPDSKIAAEFSMVATKCTYITKYGLAPYFTRMLVSRVKASGPFVMFDESLNRSTQTKQMDIHIRFWDSGRVVTRYWGSEFMGHASAETVAEHLQSSISALPKAQIQQLAMDGPSVNWKLFELICNDLKDQANINLLNVGSCGLHQVHGAFQAGAQSCGWEVSKFLSSLYWLFKDTPARREDFKTVTGCEQFPKKFCIHKWLENVPVCERAIDFLQPLKQYVDAVKAKKCIDPKTKSYSIVSEAVKDTLIQAKLAFFKSVANQLQPFLTSYQTDIPMIPFMYNDLNNLLKSMME